MVMGAKNRSKTFSGIADAMALQWGKIIEEQEIKNDSENKRSGRQKQNKQETEGSIRF